MTTIETSVTIMPDGRLTGQAPPETPPGEYRAVLEPVAPSAARLPKPPLDLRVFTWPSWPAWSTFRREDIYDDDGR